MKPETDWAYLAGVVDGDGSISIMPKRRAHTFYVELNIRMTSKETVLRCAEIGGGGAICAIPAQSDRWKDMWGWCIQGRPAAAVIRRMRPYLVAKAPQADIALAFPSEWSRNKKGVKGALRLPPWIKLGRYLSYTAMRQANRRGK